PPSIVRLSAFPAVTPPERVTAKLVIVTSSLAVGSWLFDQLAAVFHRLSPPPLSKLTAAASATPGRSRRRPIEVATSNFASPVPIVHSCRAVRVQVRVHPASCSEVGKRLDPFESTLGQVPEIR